MLTLALVLASIIMSYLIVKEITKLIIFIIKEE